MQIQSCLSPNSTRITKIGSFSFLLTYYELCDRTKEAEALHLFLPSEYSYQRAPQGI